MPSLTGPREIKMSHPSPMPLPTSSLGQLWLSSHHSDDNLYSFIGTEQYTDHRPMEEEPLEQSLIHSFRSESSPLDLSTSLGDESSYVSSSLFITSFNLFFMLQYPTLCQETRTPVTFFPYFLTMDTLFSLSLTTFSLHVLPNRLYSPLLLVFVAASSLT